MQKKMTRTVYLLRSKDGFTMREYKTEKKAREYLECLNKEDFELAKVRIDTTVLENIKI